MNLKPIFAALLTAASLPVMADAIGQTTESETLKVWIDNFTIDANGESVAYLKVYENDVIDYTAFNMTFQVPEGLKIHQVKSGRETVNDIQLSGRAAGAHTISCALWDDGTTLRVISTSTQNDNFYPDDEDGNPLDLLYTIGLVADTTMPSGTYPIDMTGIKFVLKNGDACFPVGDHVTAEVTVNNENIPTGVSAVSVEAIDGPCFDTSGRRVVNPTPGTIVIYNGKKVMVR